MKRNLIVPTIKQIIEKYSADIPDEIHSIILFGSYARGDHTVRSDVDLALVLMPGSYRKINTKATLTNLLTDTLHDVEINCFVTTDEKLQNTITAKDTNYHIRKEGQLLWMR